MGTRVKPPEVTLQCGHWNPPDETPDVLYCLFWNVEKGDRVGAKEPPNGHIFKLEHHNALPCDWRASNDAFGWEVNANLQSNNITIDLRESVIANRVYFIDTRVFPPWNEYDTFVNDKQWPAGEWGCYGYCIFWWGEMVWALAEALNLDHLDDLMLETFPVSADELVVKFCSETIRANVKLKISP